MIIKNIAPVIKTDLDPHNQFKHLLALDLH